MFSKNLSMKHEFVFEEMDNELYILMGKHCKCCEGNTFCDQFELIFHGTRKSSNIEETKFRIIYFIFET